MIQLQAVGAGNDTIDGGSGADLLAGGAGNDSILGGSGSDSITAGSGADSVTGGAGNDTFTVTAADTATDTITDWGNGVDVLASTAYTSAGTLAITTSDSSATALDMSTVLSTVAYASVTGGTADTITTGSLADTISGGSGTDSIVSGDAADSVDAGARNDIIKIALAADLDSNESISGGTDTDQLYLVAAGAYDLTNISSSYDDLVTEGGIEQLVVTHTAVTLDEAIDGTALNINTAGAVTLAATIALTDTDFSLANLTFTATDLNPTITETALATGDDKFVVTTSSTATSVTGSSIDDSITGAAGNDTIVGGSGADSIIGGVGNDSFTGGAGADTFVIGNVASEIDTITDWGNGVDVLNHTAVGTATALTADPVLIVTASDSSATALNVSTIMGTSGTLSFTGGTAADTVTGGEEVDTISGSSGADALNGGDSADSINGGADNDTIVITAAADLDSNESISGGAGTDTLVVTAISTDLTNISSSYDDLVTEGLI